MKQKRIWIIGILCSFSLLAFARIIGGLGGAIQLFGDDRYGYAYVEGGNELAWGIINASDVSLRANVYIGTNSCTFVRDYYYIPINGIYMGDDIKDEADPIPIEYHLEFNVDYGLIIGNRSLSTYLYYATAPQEMEDDIKDKMQ